MKRFLSITLCVMMIASLFAVNVSAAIPTEKVTADSSMTLLLSQDFEETANNTNFTSFYGTSGHDAEKSGVEYEDADAEVKNNVFTMDYGDLVREEGIITGLPGGVAHMQLTNGTVKTRNLNDNGTVKVLPTSYMVEFDANEKIAGAGLGFGLRAISTGESYFFVLHPDYANDDTWYTYRIYVDEKGAENVTDQRANVQKTIRAFRKLRGSSADFEALTLGKEIVYSTSGTANAAMVFTITANRNWKFASTCDTSAATGQYSSNIIDAFDTVYQLDNIKVYGITDAVTSAYELNNSGVYKTLDMETPENSITITDKTTWRWTYAGNDTNSYIKFAPGKIGNLVDNIILTSDNTTVQLPNSFILSFDACNEVLGSSLYLDIYGPADGTVAAPKAGISIRSIAADKGVWYTYKLCLDVDPEGGAGSSMDCKVYRRLAGTTGAWTLLTNDTEYKFSGTLSSAVTNRSLVRIGCSTTNALAAYENDTDNAKGVWSVDNLQATAACAYTGNVSVSGSTVTAELNVAAATSTATPIVAVYNGSTLVNAGHATVADGSVNITVENYTAGNKVMLYIWDSLANGVPVLTEALDITSLL